MKREVDAEGRVFYTIRSGSKTYAYYEDTPIYPSDVWDDIEHLHQRDPERTGYDTQKPEALLNRIILASSRPGDTVMDLFSGSGTTAVAADRLGRSWVAADCSPAALMSLRARMLRAHGEATLFTVQNEMLLSFPEYNEYDTDADIRIRRTGSRVKAELVSFSGEPVAYYALGTVEYGIFRHLACSLSPKAGTAIAAMCPGTPAVQLCDAAGNMRFLEFPGE